MLFNIGIACCRSEEPIALMSASVVGVVVAEGVGVAEAVAFGALGGAGDEVGVWAAVDAQLTRKPITRAVAAVCDRRIFRFGEVVRRS